LLKSPLVGDGTFGLPRTNVLNLRKAAVFELASQRFDTARNQISVVDGIVSGNGKAATYGELVAGQELNLTIPVTGSATNFSGLQIAGDPPFKPVKA